ncbi:hypothetical protein HYT23_00505 [Candidatus Pacearchaeota archaeon]|nr:hypothetical protein [Candidatus Pacearchaeota archaeon]
MKLVIDYTRPTIMKAGYLSTQVYATLFNKRIIPKKVIHEFDPELLRGKLTYLLRDRDAALYGEEGLAEILKEIKLDNVRLENDE